MHEPPLNMPPDMIAPLAHHAARAVRPSRQGLRHRAVRDVADAELVGADADDAAGVGAGDLAVGAAAAACGT